MLGGKKLNSVLKLNILMPEGDPYTNNNNTIIIGKIRTEKDETGRGQYDWDITGTLRGQHMTIQYEDRNEKDELP